MTRFAGALFVGVALVLSFGCGGGIGAQQCAQWEVASFMPEDLFAPKKTTDEKTKTTDEKTPAPGAMKQMMGVSALPAGWEPFAGMGMGVTARRCVK